MVAVKRADQLNDEELQLLADVTRVPPEWARQGGVLRNFKVWMCPAHHLEHTWQECMYAHPTENCTRRDPALFSYSHEQCKDYKKYHVCLKGDFCECAHGNLEHFYHPAVYRTKHCIGKCNGGPCCRALCAFAHRGQYLRDDVVCKKDSPIFDYAGNQLLRKLRQQARRDPQLWAWMCSFCAPGPRPYVSEYHLVDGLWMNSTTGQLTSGVKIKAGIIRAVHNNLRLSQRDGVCKPGPNPYGVGPVRIGWLLADIRCSVHIYKLLEAAAAYVQAKQPDLFLKLQGMVTMDGPVGYMTTETLLQQLIQAIWQASADKSWRPKGYVYREAAAFLLARQKAGGHYERLCVDVPAVGDNVARLIAQLRESAQFAAPEAAQVIARRPDKERKDTPVDQMHVGLLLTLHRLSQGTSNKVDYKTLARAFDLLCSLKPAKHMSACRGADGFAEYGNSYGNANGTQAESDVGQFQYRTDLDDPEVATMLAKPLPCMT